MWCGCSGAASSTTAGRYAPVRLYSGSEEIFARALQWMIWTNYSLDPAMHTLVMHLERLAAEQRSAAAVDAARRDAVRKLELIETREDRMKFSAKKLLLGLATVACASLGLACCTSEPNCAVTRYG